MVQYPLDGGRSSFYHSSRLVMRFEVAAAWPPKAAATSNRLCSWLLWQYKTVKMAKLQDLARFGLSAMQNRGKFGVS
jgi:hypothetical protein